MLAPDAAQPKALLANAEGQAPDRDGPRARRPWLEPALIVGIGLAMVLGLFHPILPHLETRLVGLNYGEMTMGSWANQVAVRSILVEHRFPTRVPNIVYPEGSVLYPMSLTTVLLSLPLFPFLKAAGVFNLAMMLNVLLAFLGAYLFLRQVGGRPYAALPGAVLFTLCPYTLDHLAFGPIESTAVGWIPLALFALLRFPGCRPGPVLVKGAALGLAFAANPYYGVFTLGAAAFLLLVRPLPSLRFRLREAALVLGLGVLLATPQALAIKASVAHPQSLAPSRIQPRNPQKQKIFLQRDTVHDVASLVLPLRDLQPRLLEQSLYLGFPSLLLGALAFLRVRTSRRYGLLWLLFTLYAIGYTLRAGGEFVEVAGQPIRMPAYWLTALIPPLSDLYYPSRCYPIAVLGLGAMMTLLLARGGFRRPGMHALLLAVGIGAELVWGYPSHAPVELSPFNLPRVLRTIRDMPGEFGVVDLPMPKNDTPLALLYHAQLVHRKRIPYNLDFDGFSDGKSPAALQFVEGLALFESLPNKPRDLVADLPFFRCNIHCPGLEQMAARGYRLVVLHHCGYEPLFRKHLSCLETCLKNPIYKDNQVRVYRIPSQLSPRR